VKDGARHAADVADGFARLDVSALFGQPLVRPDLGGAHALRLVMKLDVDRVHVFPEASRMFSRTRAALTGLTGLVDHLLTPARAAGLIDDDGAYDVFLATLFILVIDDRFDEAMGIPASADVVDRFVAQLLVRAASTAGDVPSCFLVALFERLRLRPGWVRFGGLFADEIEAMIRGMALESKERGGFVKAPSSFEEYLAYAGDSVGLGVGLAAALVVINDCSVEKCISPIRQVHRLASRMARIANDLRSRKRELKEGRSNIITVAARQLGIPDGRVVAEQSTLMGAIEALALRELASLRGALRLIGSVTGVPEEIAMRAVTGLLTLYEVGDLHDFSQPTA